MENLLTSLITPEVVDDIASLIDDIIPVLKSILPVLDSDAIKGFLNDIGTILATIPIFSGNVLSTLVANLIPLVKAVVAVRLFGILPNIDIN